MFIVDHNSHTLSFVYIALIHNKQNTQTIQTTDIAKLVSEAWRELDPDEKEDWEKKARKDKARYEVEKAMYKGPWKVPANRRTPKDVSLLVVRIWIWIDIVLGATTFFWFSKGKIKAQYSTHMSTLSILFSPRPQSVLCLRL
jgi:HMG (high mobility group) box